MGAIEAFFARSGLVRHHLDSYAHFIQTIIPDTISETPGFNHETEDYKFAFQFENVYLHKPSVVENDGTITELYPNECRLRNLLYGSPFFAQVRKRLYSKLTKQTTETVQNVFCGMIPTMVRSIQCRLYQATTEELYAAKECIYDQGGYFIVGGTERILMGMEKMAVNQVYVFPNKSDPDDIYAEISSLEEKARKAPSPFHIHLTVSSNLGKKTARASFSAYFKSEFPVGILLKALGKTEYIKKDIISNHRFRNVKGKNWRELETLVDSIEEESYFVSTQEAAFEYLSSIATTNGSTEAKSKAYVNAVLQKEFLPHVGIDEKSYKKKERFLIYMIQRLLLTYYKQRDYDDHDNCKNKRTDESGVLLGFIFKQVWNKVTRELHILVKRKLENGNALADIDIGQLLNNLSLTKDMTYVISTGNWTVIRSSKNKTGVSQVLNRFNLPSAISHSRRNINPMPKNSVMNKPRQLHNTSWGNQCPFETPEGHAIGLVKNKALSSTVTVGFSDIITTELMHKKGLSDSPSEDTIWTVFCNGKIVGYDKDDSMYHYIRGLKMTGALPADMGVYRDLPNFEVQVFTDSGRSCRPLFIVTNNTIGLTKKHIEEMATGEKNWDDLITEGVVEMVDVGEQENLLVCVDPAKLKSSQKRYTHCELSPSLLIGVCASVIPYANSDPSARITYQSSMTKQSLSVTGTNMQHRMDTMAHAMHYPQKTLCPTKTMPFLRSNDLPAGANAVVFVTTYGGWNQEDSIIMSKAAIDRGMFRSTFYRSYKDSEKKTVGSEEIFAVPPNETGTDKLQPDGIVAVGTYVEEDDMIIGKVSNAIGLDGQPIKPRYVRVRHGEHGIVDAVMVSNNPDGTKSVKVRVRQERVPQVGDKFAATHSQKGVLGAIMRQEDLPYTSEGITPDIIINPHSQPSRMTIGHMKEIRSGKFAALSGQTQDSTIFERHDMEKIGEGLKELGYERQGWEVVYNGTTGEMMQALIYVGVCYYQRLKHMVDDKIHARGSRGPVTSLTHQPSDGKARDGGLRIGEMERDCLISLGASYTLTDRLMNLSDKFECPLCEECGLIAIHNSAEKIAVCKACKSKKIVVVHMPYATKLLIHNLYSVGIAPRIKVK